MLYNDNISCNFDDLLKKGFIEVNCSKHGKCLTTIKSLLNGDGCPKCKSETSFINKATEIHLNKYVYKNVVYKDKDEKVCIICPTHGEFWQTPHNHICFHGCPHCNESNLEILTKSILKKHKIDYVQQKTFEWLKVKDNLRLDFYLPKYNIAIECQGEQHFKSIEIFGGEEAFQKRKEYDYIKKKLCDENKLAITYITYKNPKQQIENFISSLPILI